MYEDLHVALRHALNILKASIKGATSLLITKHTTTGEVHVFLATADQVKSFNTADYIDNAIAGWEVETPEQLSKTGLTEKDLITLHNEVNPTRPIASKSRNKRQLCEVIFADVQRIARPYDMTPAKADKHVPKVKAVEIIKPQRAARVVAQKDGSFLHPAHAKATAARRGTCIAMLIDVTWKGASFEDLQAAVPNWQPSSIISGLKHDVRNKGYGIKAWVAEGIIVYQLLLPEGLDEPIPHKD